MIVDRRRQHQHLTILELCIDLFHVILLNAGTIAGPMAILASHAAFDVFLTHIDDFHIVTLGLRLFYKDIAHPGGIAVRPWTSVQYQYFHVYFLYRRRRTICALIFIISDFHQRSFPICQTGCIPCRLRHKDRYGRHPG